MNEQRAEHGHFLDRREVNAFYALQTYLMNP